MFSDVREVRYIDENNKYVFIESVTGFPRVPDREKLILDTVKAYNAAYIFSGEREVLMKELNHEIEKYIELVVSMESFFCSSMTYRIDLNWNNSHKVNRIVFFNRSNGKYKFHFFFEDDKIFKRCY